jgi:cell wall-associated NlpC family hydrolase
MVSKSDIVDAARAYLGTPYHHQGRVRDGLDCLGLLVMVCRDLGLPHVDRNDYARIPEGDRLVTELREHTGREMRPSEAVPGDILVFRYLRRPRHVAIKTYAGMIHAWAQAGEVVEHSMDERWLRQCVTAFEFKGVACSLH